MDKEIHYELFDDGGSCALWLPIIMLVGTQFHHEYGNYKVEQHGKDSNGVLLIICERISTDIHPELK